MTKPITAAIAVACAPVLMLSLIAGVVFASEDGRRGSAGQGLAGAGGGLKEGVGGRFRPWILKAGATCPQVSPALIAAQLSAESNFNDTAQGPPLAGGVRAQGIAQFIPSTFATYGQDDDGNGRVSVWDAGDSIMAQARLMCQLVKDAERSGYSGGTIPLALAGYNAGWGHVARYQGIPPFKETTGYIAAIMKQAAEWTAAGSGGGSSRFTDGRQSWTLNNPRTVEQAIAWAKANAGANSSAGWYNRCLAYTSIVYGWNFSGVTYAIDHFSVVPKEMQHTDRNPPPGALMYWDTGSRAGHIAVYLGNGQIASNDILRRGYIDIVSADLIETKWGARYVGWTPPHFPRAG
ncbi:transglycosylase SLT domain-containing protein [Streptomyces sp. URMC 123]|uniref:transglycosylase SLT domain-containing protein n=1 Tax=Streptomyces sp. URMC 123 TaxID=3423403 RepID=UPI003F1B06EF